jgi:xanthine dehydrogenase accessory factor
VSKRLPAVKDLIVLIKGAGEMATGVAHRLARSGFRICLTEIAEPLAVRRGVSFCEAVFEGTKVVEGVTAKRVATREEIEEVWQDGELPIIVDPACSLRAVLKPDVLIDAILAKENRGTRLDDAPLVIALGPGFWAGRDAHFVIETNRGHRLGRVIEEGEAEPNTGIPGEIAGLTWERVLRAPCAGRFQSHRSIGDPVSQGEIVAEVEGIPIKANIPGVMRGLLRDGLKVKEKMKVGDVDPRGIQQHCFTISEKARAIGGGVLEAILRKYNRET